MSTNFRFTNETTFLQVKKAIKSLGLSISPTKEATKNSFCLTDGEAYLWCYNTKPNIEMVRYGGNDVQHILETLQEKFGEIISEHDEGYFDEEDEDVENT